MKKVILGAVMLSMFGMSSSLVMAASEAVIAQAAGKVMVDSGKGFVPARVGAELQNGDRVVALKASSATINFSHGCTLSLVENNLVTISREAGCKADIVALNSVADTSAIAAVGQGGFDWAPVIGLGSFGGAGAIYAASNSNNDTKPISGQ